MNKLLKINNFTLKIFACITMVFDHVGIFLSLYFPSSSVGTIVNVFRIIGRLSFPIFAFLIVEGALHTKNLKLYILRIGIMASAISVFLLVFQYTNLFGVVSTANVTNIFFQFVLCLSTIFFLNLRKWKKLLALIPLAYVVFVYTSQVLNAPYMTYYPMAFIPDYGLYGFIIIVGSYLILKYYKNNVKNILQDEQMIKAYEETPKYQYTYNAFAILPLLIMSIVITLLRYVYPAMNTLDVSIQSYAALAAIPLIFYNGKLGINNKFVKYGFYLFYPVHMILIFVIFILL